MIRAWIMSCRKGSPVREERDPVFHLPLLSGITSDLWYVTAKIAIFQHEPAEAAGYLEQVFSGHNVPFEYVRLWETGEVPRTDATHLVFMGGPMSVNNEREFPYLREEKELIRRAVKKGTKVLGICLGAQLIASACGAPVYRSVSETGWHGLDIKE